MITKKLLEDDIFEFLDLNNFSPGVPLKLEIKHNNGKKDIILV